MQIKTTFQIAKNYEPSIIDMMKINHNKLIALRTTEGVYFIEVINKTGLNSSFSNKN